MGTFEWVVRARGAPDETWPELGRVAARDKRAARQLAAARWPGEDLAIHSRAELEIIRLERAALERGRIAPIVSRYAERNGRDP